MCISCQHPWQETENESAIHGSHDHVDGAKDRHDVGNLVSLEDVRKDLQIVAVCGTNFEAPGCDVVIALNEYANLALPRLQSGIELAIGDLECGCVKLRTNSKRKQ